MHTELRIRRRLLSMAMVAVLLASLVVGFAPQPTVAQMTTPMDGMVCTMGSGSMMSPTFTLTTQRGYILTPDSNSVYMWGFSAGSDPYQYPGPVLCVQEGAMVTVVLNNTLPQPVSIVFPGQDHVMADGALAQPQFDAGGALTSLTNAAPTGGSVTYSFTATHPGTFIYESGTNQGIQVPMGLFGALIVRPMDGDYYVYDDAALPQTSEFNHGWVDQMGNYMSGEFLVLQSEVDPYLSQAVERWAEQGQPFNFNMNNYHPRYWFLNGRGFPDTLAPNFASWLPSQPYGALAHIIPNVETPGDPQLLHYLERFGNVSSQVLPFHPHGRNALVIGRDAEPVRGPAGQDLSGETFALTAAPGQTYDALFHYHNLEGYDPNTNPIPVTDPGWQNLTYGPMYGGSPYLGVMGPLVPGNPSQNMCGEYYIIAHNHALFQLTSWGVVMTGPGTFLRIDPPGGCPAMP